MQRRPRIRLAPALFFLVSAACAAHADETGTAIGERIPRFTSGDFDSHATERPTAYLFLGNGCPATRAYADRIRALDGAYAGKVDFVYLYPNKTDKAADKRAHHKALGVKGLFIDDEQARIAKLVGAARTTEVLVVDKHGTIVYRGAIDDSKDAPAKVRRRHVAVALDEILAGKKVTTPKTDVFA